MWQAKKKMSCLILRGELHVLNASDVFFDIYANGFYFMQNENKIFGGDWDRNLKKIQ